MMNAQRRFPVIFQFIPEISSRFNKQKNGRSRLNELIPTMSIFFFTLKPLQIRHHQQANVANMERRSASRNKDCHGSRQYGHG